MLCVTLHSYEDRRGEGMQELCETMTSSNAQMHHPVLLSACPTPPLSSLTGGPALRLHMLAVHGLDAWHVLRGCSLPGLLGLLAARPIICNAPSHAGAESNIKTLA